MCINIFINIFKIYIEILIIFFLGLRLKVILRGSVFLCLLVFYIEYILLFNFGEKYF